MWPHVSPFKKDLFRYCQTLYKDRLWDSDILVAAMGFQNPSQPCFRFEHIPYSAVALIVDCAEVGK
jgi:hypothetical protein